MFVSVWWMHLEYVCLYLWVVWISLKSKMVCVLCIYIYIYIYIYGFRYLQMHTLVCVYLCICCHGYILISIYRHIIFLVYKMTPHSQVLSHVQLLTHKYMCHYFCIYHILLKSVLNIVCLVYQKMHLNLMSCHFQSAKDSKFLWDFLNLLLYYVSYANDFTLKIYTMSRQMLFLLFLCLTHLHVHVCTY